jgi:hypothetical protein
MIWNNYKDIAEHIGGEKTKEECEKHYEELYMSRKDDGFIPKNIPILSKRDKDGFLIY